MPPILTALIRSMRPKQWSKNGFLLAALIFDRQLFDWVFLERTLAAMALFCLLSSAIYIYNDIRDIDTDRKHPTKRYRPIAAGDLPLPAAYAAVVVLLLVVDAPRPMPPRAADQSERRGSGSGVSGRRHAADAPRWCSAAA